MKITKTAETGLTSVSAIRINIADPGGYYGGGPLTLEEWVALVGSGALGPYLTKILGGQGTTFDLDPMGSSSTVDIANGNLAYGELTADCSITTTGWVPGADCQILLELTEDATGDWLPTLSGITWKTNPPTAAAAGEVIHVALFSRDGGTTIWGAVLGADAAVDAMVPHLIESGETFTVPEKKQALFNMAITVDAGGSLVVESNAFLLMVT